MYPIETAKLECSVILNSADKEVFLVKKITRQAYGLYPFLSSKIEPPLTEGTIDKTAASSNNNLIKQTQPQAKMTSKLNTQWLQRLFIAIITLSIANTQADEITIVADLWEPYNGQPNSDKPGYGIEISRRIFEAAGHSVKYSLMPWKRALVATQRGQFNAVIGAYKEDAPGFVFPEEKFGVSRIGFFTTSNSQWRYDGPSSLLPLKVGLINAYSYGSELDTFFKKNKQITRYAHGIDPLANNIEALLQGKLDILCEDPNVFYRKSTEMKLRADIIMVGEHSQTFDIYVAFSPSHPKSKHYAELFSTGIKNLKRSGELQKILAKYDIEYWNDH